MELVGIDWQTVLAFLGGLLLSLSFIFGFGMGDSSNRAIQRAAMPTALTMLAVGGLLCVLAVAGVWQ